jgi:hypothetical protein
MNLLAEAFQVGYVRYGTEASAFGFSFGDFLLESQSRFKMI